LHNGLPISTAIQYSNFQRVGVHPDNVILEELAAGKQVENATFVVTSFAINTVIIFGRGHVKHFFFQKRGQRKFQIWTEEANLRNRKIDLVSLRLPSLLICKLRMMARYPNRELP